MKKQLTLSLLFIFCYRLCSAQETGTVGYRPKIAELSVESFLDYQTVSQSETLDNGRHQVDRDHLLRIKLGAPIVMNKRHMIATQFKYYEHGFQFDDEVSPDQVLYRHLNSNIFRSAGMRLFYCKYLPNESKLAAGIGVEIKSDQFTWNKEAWKYMMGAMYERKLNSRKTIGFGLNVNYALLVPSVYPVLKYENTLTDKITLDLLLPKSGELRYRLNEKTYLIGRGQVRGWRYQLTSPYPNPELGNLMLRKADVQITGSVEREIHDWFWVSFEGGWSKNLRYYLANPGGRNRDALVSLQAANTPFFKLNFFLVPPRKFYK